MSEYAKRDAAKLDPYYSRHVNAMTAEGLHEKSDIAAELAWRDQEIASLKARVADLVDTMKTLAKIVGLQEPSAEKLIARIAELEAAQQWRPIVEAPMDGKSTLLLHTDKRVLHAHRGDGNEEPMAWIGEMCGLAYLDDEWEFIGWLPLPATTEE